MTKAKEKKLKATLFEKVREMIQEAGKFAKSDDVVWTIIYLRAALAKEQSG